MHNVVNAQKLCINCASMLAPIQLCGKVFYHLLVDWLRENVHIDITHHPIEEGKVFSLGLLNSVAGLFRVSFN